jgi:hypothetical protein
MPNIKKDLDNRDRDNLINYKTKLIVSLGY